MLRKANGTMAMTVFLRIAIGLAVLLLPLGHRCVAEDNGAISRGYEAVTTDFGNFYLDRANLTRLGIGVGVAAVFANTNMDMYIRDKYQNSTRSHVTDQATKIFNITGTEIALVAGTVYLGTYGAGVWLHNPTMEEWALKSVRATVVGAPALVFLAVATGADRPTEGDSHWGPLSEFPWDQRSRVLRARFLSSPPRK